MEKIKFWVSVYNIYRLDFRPCTTADRQALLLCDLQQQTISRNCSTSLDKSEYETLIIHSRSSENAKTTFSFLLRRKNEIGVKYQLKFTHPRVFLTWLWIRVSSVHLFNSKDDISKHRPDISKPQKQNLKYPRNTTYRTIHAEFPCFFYRQRFPITWRGGG